MKTMCWHVCILSQVQEEPKGDNSCRILLSYNRLATPLGFKPKIFGFATNLAMSRDITKQQAIHHAKNLDFIYSQLGTLYETIPHAPRSSNDAPQLVPKPHTDGVVCSTNSTIVGQLTKKISQLNLVSNPISSVSMTNSTLSLTKTSEMNLVQSTTSKNLHKPIGKKKNNSKMKSHSSEHTRQQSQEPTTRENKPR